MKRKQADSLSRHWSPNIFQKFSVVFFIFGDLKVIKEEEKKIYVTKFSTLATLIDSRNDAFTESGEARHEVAFLRILPVHTWTEETPIRKI